MQSFDWVDASGYSPITTSVNLIRQDSWPNYFKNFHFKCVRLSVEARIRTKESSSQVFVCGFSELAICSMNIVHSMETVSGLKIYFKVSFKISKRTFHPGVFSQFDKMRTQAEVFDDRKLPFKWTSSTCEQRLTAASLCKLCGYDDVDAPPRQSVTANADRSQKSLCFNSRRLPFLRSELVLKVANKIWQFFVARRWRTRIYS